MNVYKLEAICDNPLFDGLEAVGTVSFFDCFPKDWHKNSSTWLPLLRKPSWSIPKVRGNVRSLFPFTA